MRSIREADGGRGVDKNRTKQARHVRLDLRRRPDTRLHDTLLERAPWLAPGDRTLIELVFREGRTLREIASLLDQPPPAIRRRLRRIATRLLDPLTAYVAAHADTWPPTRRRIAVACVLQGLSMREAAQRLGLSLHTVRRHMAAVRELGAETRRTGRWSQAKPATKAQAGASR